MAWYTAGTIAVSGTTVTGKGTNWLDNKQSIGAGQALLIPGSGTVNMYEIASVTSATKLTLKTSPGTIAAGQAYAILSFYTDSVPDFARRLAAQLSYYQSQMDGWQQIMTGTGNVTLTAPDGTSVTISSFAKLTADVSSALPRKGLLRNSGVSTVDALGPVDPYIGIWNCAGTTDYSIAGLPEATAGALENYDAGNYNSMQRYTTRNGNVWVRCLAAAWSASSPSWTSWCLVGDQPVQGYISSDLNTVLSPGTYSVTTTAANLPVSATGILEVKLRLSTNSVKQTFTTIVTTASTINRTFQRTLSGTTWSAWAEVMTSNTTVPLANGGLGQAASSIADFRTKLGVGWTTSIANPGSGIYRVLNYDDSGLMTIMRRFSVTVAANSTGTFSYNWQTELGVVFQAYPAMAINGVGGFSNFWKIGVEGGDGSQVSGYVFNTNSSSITVWITVLAIGIKS